MLDFSHFLRRKSAPFCKKCLTADRNRAKIQPSGRETAGNTRQGETMYISCR